MTEVQREVLEKLLDGGVITGKELANQIGLRLRQTGKEGADLRAVINALRRQGYPICASTNGYWYAKNEQELRDYIDSLAGRIAKETEALNGLKSILTIKNFKPLPEKMDAIKIDQNIILTKENHFFVNKKYNVIKDEIYGWQCDCEAFRYSGKKKTCKHLKEVMIFLKQQTAAEASRRQKNLF